MSSRPLVAEILEQSERPGQVEMILRIPAELLYFQGHFPDAPILPGVVQSHWVINYLQQFFAVDPSRFAAFSNLKFQQMIRPEYVVTLSLQQLSEHKFSFSYHSKMGQHASGKVLFH